MINLFKKLMGFNPKLDKYRPLILPSEPVTGVIAPTVTKVAAKTTPKKLAKAPVPVRQATGTPNQRTVSKPSQTSDTKSSYENDVSPLTGLAVMATVMADDSSRCSPPADTGSSSDYSSSCSTDSFSGGDF